MIATFGSAEAVLVGNLAALFSEESLAALFPDDELPVPRVSAYPDPKILSAPFAVIVLSRDGRSTEGQHTNGLAELTYTVSLGLAATHGNPTTASRILDRYIDIALQAALADITLRRTVTSISPAVEGITLLPDDNGHWHAEAALTYTLTLSVDRANDAAAILETP